MWTAIAILAAAAISATVGIVSQSMSNKSTRETNETNKEINESNNAFNAEQASISRDFEAEQADLTRTFNAQEAEKQRQFEADMSNTAIQRRVADLQSSGFNPMLAVTSGSASTPGAVGASSGLASSNQAGASGFIPMRAMDYSPMAVMSQNLSHMVSSAASIMKLEQMARKSPAALGAVASMSRGLARSTTNSHMVDKLTGEIKMNGLDSAIDKAVNYKHNSFVKDYEKSILDTWHKYNR